MNAKATLYLDHASTSWPKDPRVVAAVAGALVDPGVAPDRGGGGRGLESARLVARARALVAGLLSVDSPERVTLTLNATDALNLALKGVLRDGDEVVTSAVEHNSVRRPLSRLAAKRGVVVKEVAADPAGVVAARDVLRTVTARTRLVALGHASNVTGAVQPVAEIGRALAAFSAASRPLLLVDAAQTAGYRPLEEIAEVSDLIVGAGHKGPGGPLGTGFLWVRAGVAIEPQREGGTGTRSEERLQPSEWPGALEAGSPNVPGIAGLAAALELRLHETSLAAVAAARAEASREFLAGVARLDRVWCGGPSDPLAREAVFPIRVRGYSVAEAALLLENEFGISLRAGLHCNPGAHEALGTFPEGTLRLSFGAAPIAAEVETALAALRELARSAHAAG
jgi:selenocysteine lyase/cysteine desulfurase